MNTDTLNSLEQFVEKAGRPGLLGLAGRKLENICARDLKTYFNELKTKIDALHLEDRAYDLSTLRHVVEMAIENVLRKSRSTLEDAFKVNLAAAYVLASKLHPMAEDDNGLDDNDFSLTPPVTKLGDTAQAAATWAEEEVAKLVVGIDDTTVDRIASVIAQGIESQIGAQGTGVLIRAELDEMSVSRALTIASTEMNRAMSAATLDKLEALEIEYKQWILDADPCPICEENAEASPIPVGDDFPSGDDGPPAHPNCRCAVTGARAPQSDSEGDDNA